MVGLDDYSAYDGLGLAELVRAGEVSPEDVLEAAIARIESLNPRLNAVVHTNMPAIVIWNVCFGSLADVLRLPPECLLSGVKQT